VNPGAFLCGQVFQFTSENQFEKDYIGRGEGPAVDAVVRHNCLRAKIAAAYDELLGSVCAAVKPVDIHK
jgi:hypothetical protein